jgi:hypothetical protein
VPAIDHIPLDRIVIYERLSQAPLGALLQLRIDAPVPLVVVVRAGGGQSGGMPDGIVFLEGSDAGTFLHDRNIEVDPAALDITALAEIVVTSPAPIRRGPHRADLTRLYVRLDEPAVGMAVRTSLNPDVHTGYLYLAGQHRGLILQGGSWIEIGSATVIPRI